MEAGYSDAKPLKFSLLYNTSDQNKQQAIAAASMWKKNLGAEVTLRNQNGKLRWRVAIRGNTTWRVPPGAGITTNPARS